MINIGFKNALTASILSIKEFTGWTDALSYSYIQSTDYSEELQVQEIVMVMLLDIQKRIAEDNRNLIDGYVSSVILIYVIGGVIITLFFLAIAVYSLLNTLRNFTYLRKAIFLIPFKRLSEDSNTRFLLKKFIEI